MQLKSVSLLYSPFSHLQILRFFIHYVLTPRPPQIPSCCSCKRYYGGMCFMVAYLRLVSLLRADSKILSLKVTKWTLCQKKKAVRKTNLETPLTLLSGLVLTEFSCCVISETEPKHLCPSKAVFSYTFTHKIFLRGVNLD